MKAVHQNPNKNSSVVQLSLVDGREIELYIESSISLNDIADSWVFLLLPVCMQLGEDLELHGKITQSAIDSFQVAKKELLRGHKNMKDIKLVHVGELVAEEKLAKPNRKIGLFFSGGIDSTYASETISEIESLVAVWGFDIPVKNSKHWDLTTSILGSYAQKIGRELILVKTNIRELSNGLLEWGGDYHGTALAGIANSLAGSFDKMWVSAGFIRKNPNWGHSPILYRAYSTKYQKVEETDPVLRIAKARHLGEISRTVEVRACYRNVSGLANCGTCKKCVRTRLEFDLVNAKFRPKGLEKRPRLKLLLGSKLTYWDYLFYFEALNWSRKNGYKNTFKPLVAVTLARLRSLIS